MDFLALYIAARIMHASVRPLRLAAASLIGAVYALASVIISPNVRGAWVIISVGASILCALLMAACAFGTKANGIIGAAVTYGAVNVGLGGIMTVLYGFVGSIADTFGTRPVSTSPDASPLLFIVISLISGAVSLLYGKFRTRSISRRRVTAEIKLNGGVIMTELLCDSGNLLRDPFSGKPVVIVSEKSIADALPPEFMEAVRAAESGTIASERNMRIRLIPASGVMGRMMLPAVIPERVIVDGREIEAVIAVDCGSTDFDGCGGIVSPEVLTV